MTTITNFTEAFPHKELTPLPPNTKPTHAYLKGLKRQVYANLQAIPSTAGGGTYGHLGLGMPPVAYNALPNAQPWVTPPHPGLAPALPAAPTAAQITEANRVYELALRHHTQAQACENTLRQQVLTAVPSTYTQVLADDMLGFSNVLLQTILDHLDATYGHVEPEDLKRNEERLEAPWDTATPIEDLWGRYRECVAFAAPHDPLTDAKLLRTILATMDQTGLFATALDKWKDKPAADRTLANAYTHFEEENRRRLEALTSSEAGFMARQGVPPSDAQSAVAFLSQLTPHQAFAAAEAYRRSQNPQQDQSPASSDWLYCWTHGCQKTHTSAQCNRQATGHQTAATMSNMMGGNNTISRSTGERAVWRPPPRRNRNGNRQGTGNASGSGSGTDTPT